MQVSVESVDEANPLARKMTVQIPKERLEEEVEKRFKSLTRTARINGFRPGKVPLRVIKQKYGMQVRQEVFGEILEESLQEAVQQENLHIAGQPAIAINSELEKLETEGLSYTADFEVFPELDEIHLDGLEMEKIVSEVTDRDVDNMLEKLRKQRCDWEPIETPIQQDHRVKLDFSATIDGAAFEDSEMQDIYLVIENKPVFSQQFEDNLLGAQAGDDLTFSITFDDDHQNSIIAGKQVDFKVHIHEVTQAVLPELDEAFAESLGVESGDLAILKTDIRENMQRELQKALKSKLKAQVMQVVLDANPIQVPNTLLESEKDRLVERINSEIAAYNTNQNYQAKPEDYENIALKRVRQGLLMAELIRANELRPSAAKVEAEIVNLASTYEEPAAFISWFYSDEERLREVEASVLEEELIEWLLDKIAVTEKTMDFDAVINDKTETADIDD